MELSNKSFSDLAKSIAEERYKSHDRGPSPSGIDYEIIDSINDMREAYEACINEVVRPMYEALILIKQRSPLESSASIQATQAIANFEGGVKGKEDFNDIANGRD